MLSLQVMSHILLLSIGTEVLSGRLKYTGLRHTSLNCLIGAWPKC
jgi:hypothetical protein